MNTISNQKIQLLDISLEELIIKIKESVVDELKEILRNPSNKDDLEYLTRKEVSKMLKIDLSTLHRWSKNGTLTRKNIGGRVYYLKKEIDEYLKENIG